MKRPKVVSLRGGVEDNVPLISAKRKMHVNSRTTKASTGTPAQHIEQRMRLPFFHPLFDKEEFPGSSPYNELTRDTPAILPDTIPPHAPADNWTANTVTVGETFALNPGKSMEVDCHSRLVQAADAL